MSEPGNQRPEQGPPEDDPPDELLEEMGLAAEVYERLAARGRELRFRLDPPTGRVTVEVRDLDGKLLYTIPPTRALEIAGGEDLDDV
jgi:flagellar protein FlaG